MVNPLVYIIILNYNNYKDTIECINSLEKIKYDNYKIVLVDNNSTNESDKMLSDLYSIKYKYIQTGKNIGYAAGNNVGIKHALDNNAEYVCVLNNDTIVRENFLQQLVEYSEENPNVGMIGPVILEYSNPELIQSTGGNINIKKGNVDLVNHSKPVKEVLEKEIKCDYIGGACIVVKKEVIEKIGLIPENYFLFYEETEWCYKAKQSGFDIACYMPSQILHKGSVSINSLQGLSEYLMKRNKVVFVKRNAKFSQRIFFYGYLFLQTIWRTIKGKDKIKALKYYGHGLLNIIDKKYPFIYINNKY